METSAETELPVAPREGAVRLVWNTLTGCLFALLRLDKILLVFLLFFVILSTPAISLVLTDGFCISYFLVYGIGSQRMVISSAVFLLTFIIIWSSPTAFRQLRFELSAYLVLLTSGYILLLSLYIHQQPEDAQFIYEIIDSYNVRR